MIDCHLFQHVCFPSIHQFPSVITSFLLSLLVVHCYNHLLVKSLTSFLFSSFFILFWKTPATGELSHLCSPCVHPKRLNTSHIHADQLLFVSFFNLPFSSLRLTIRNILMIPHENQPALRRNFTSNQQFYGSPGTSGPTKKPTSWFSSCKPFVPVLSASSSQTL